MAHTAHSTDAPVVKVKASTTLPSTVTTGQTVFVEDTILSAGSIQRMVVLGLVLCGSCLLAGFWWKRRKKKAQMKKDPMAEGNLQVFPSSYQMHSVSIPLTSDIRSSDIR
ncbi:unnamed protein product [Lota lota]